MKHLLSFFVIMLMTISVSMAETHNVTATYCIHYHDTLVNGYQVGFNENNVFFYFEVNGVNSLENDHQYLLSDMVSDSTFACRYIRTEDGLRADTISYEYCWLQKDASDNFTALVVTATDSFNITYTKPSKVHNLTLTADTNYLADRLATGSFFQIVAYNEGLDYTLVLTIKGVSQIDGTYFTPDVWVREDSLSVLFYTKLAHETDNGYEGIYFNALAPTASIWTSNDKVIGVVEYLSTDNELYHINFECKKIRTALDNVTTSSCIAYTQGSDILLAGAEGEMATVYDMHGRMICNRQVSSDIERFEVAANGVYFIQVNNQTLRVVVR